MKLLLVEDNRELASWLAKALRQSQYAIDIAFDGEDAWHLFSVAEYAAIVLDLGLPDMDGLTLLKRIRKAGSRVPVIILTANAGLEGRVRGLDAGADDYLAKPFDIAELEARLRAVIRRSHDRAAPEMMVGDLMFNGGTRQFFLKGEPLKLTPREHSVLECLIMKSGTTVTKPTLYESVFGLEETGDINAIEIYVHRARKKLEGSAVEIATLRGLGYLLRPAGRGQNGTR